MTDLVAQSHQRRLETQVREWICEKLGTEAPSDASLLEWLKDGVILCRLANAVRSGAVARVNAPATLPFKQLENLTNAAAAFKALGVPPSVLFVAADLQAAAVNGGAAHTAERILASLDSIRRHLVAAPPPALLSANNHSSSKPSSHVQLPSAAVVAARLAAHSSSARPASLPSSPVSTLTAAQAAAVASPVGVTVTTTESPLRSGSSASSVRGGGSGFGLAAGAASVRSGGAATADVSSLNADVETAKEFKYNPETERKVRAWVEAVLGAPLPDDSFQASLKSGVALCKLFGLLHPTAPKLDGKIYDGKVAYLQMQNISLYIKACEGAGMRQIDLFDTTDLFDNKNMIAVLNHIVTLASRCAKRPGYAGPVLEDVKGDRSLFSHSLVAADNAPFLQSDAGAAAAHEGAAAAEALSRGDRNMLDWVRASVGDASAAWMSKAARPAASAAARALHWQDLRSGAVLLHLIGKLCDADVGFHHARPTLMWHAMHNASLVLRAVETHTNNAVPGCSARDIVLGERGGLLALLRYLRSRYDMAYLFQQKLLEAQFDGDALDDAIATALEDESAAAAFDDDEDDDDDDEEAEKKRLEALEAERAAIEAAEHAVELKRRESLATRIAATSQPATPQRRSSTRASAMPSPAALSHHLTQVAAERATSTDAVLSDIVSLPDNGASVPLSPRRYRGAAPAAVTRVALLRDGKQDADSDDESTEESPDAAEKPKKSRKAKTSSSARDEKRKKAKSSKKSTKSARPGSRGSSSKSVRANADDELAAAATAAAAADEEDDKAHEREQEDYHAQSATLRAKRQAVEAQIEAIARPATSAPRPGEATIARGRRAKKLADSVAIASAAKANVAAREAAAPPSPAKSASQVQISAAYAAVRLQVAKEFLSTERSYVGSLSRVCDELRQPLCALLERNEPVLIGNEIDQIFSNVAALRERHAGFLAALDALVSAWSETSALGECLTAQLTFLDEYAVYLRNFEEAQIHLHVCRRSRPEFGAMLGAFEASGVSLSSLLVMPVQRIPRYLLLLENMCRYTTADHADFAALKAARSAMQKKLAALNDGLDKAALASDAATVMRIEKAIDGVDTLVGVGRRFVCEGRLKLKAVDRSATGLDSKQLSLSLVVLGREKPKLVKQQFWLLFSDIFVYCEHSDTDVTSSLAPLADDDKRPFQYVAHLPISSVAAVERALPGSKEDRAFQFTLVTPLERLVFVANSATERDNWISAVEQQQQTRR